MRGRKKVRPYRTGRRSSRNNVNDFFGGKTLSAATVFRSEIESMEKKVLAVKANMNYYLMFFVLCLICIVPFVLFLVLDREESELMHGFFIVLTIVMAGFSLYFLVAGIQMCRLPKELIVFENGTLTVFTRKGRADVSLRDVQDVRTGRKVGWYARRRDLLAEHRVILTLTQGELRVDMVSDAEAVLKAVTELKAKPLSEESEA